MENKFSLRAVFHAVGTDVAVSYPPDAIPRGLRNKPKKWGIYQNLPSGEQSLLAEVEHHQEAVDLITWLNHPRILIGIVSDDVGIWTFPGKTREDVYRKVFDEYVSDHWTLNHFVDTAEANAYNLGQGIEATVDMYFDIMNENRGDQFLIRIIQ